MRGVHANRAAIGGARRVVAARVGECLRGIELPLCIGGVRDGGRFEKGSAVRRPARTVQDPALLVTGEDIARILTQHRLHEAERLVDALLFREQARRAEARRRESRAQHQRLLVARERCRRLAREIERHRQLELRRVVRGLQRRGALQRDARLGQPSQHAQRDPRGEVRAGVVRIALRELARQRERARRVTALDAAQRLDDRRRVIHRIPGSARWPRCARGAMPGGKATSTARPTPS